MAMVEGWYREDNSNERPVPNLIYGRDGTFFQICATPVGVEIYSPHHGQNLVLKTDEDREGLVAVVLRAWNQHVHLKECPDGPPLSENEELS